MIPKSSPGPAKQINSVLHNEMKHRSVTPDKPSNVVTSFIYKEGVKVPKHVTKIEFDERVTTISDNAFEGCQNLTELVLCDGITKIGDYAFKNCSQLEHITLPKNLISFGEGTFFECSNLSRIDLPDSFSSMGAYAFIECCSLTSIRFPNQLSSIPEGAFFECTSLASVEFPKHLKSIGKYAFYSCSSLVSLSLPENLISIGGEAFTNCSSLLSLAFPTNLETIQNQAFSGCSKLMSIAVPNFYTYIDERAFAGCRNLMTILLSENFFLEAQNNSSNTATTIANDAFEGCHHCLFQGYDETDTDNSSPIMNYIIQQHQTSPLHSICSTIYGSSIDLKQNIQKCIEKYPDCAKQVNENNLSPLHILALNPNVTQQCLKILTEEYPGALTIQCNENGMLPQQLLLLNPNVHIDWFSPAILNAKTSDGKYANSIKNKENDTLASLAIYLKCKEEIQHHLYSYHPVKSEIFSNRSLTFMSQLRNIEQQYIDDITNITSKKRKTWSAAHEHGWVQFLINTPVSDTNTTMQEQVKNFIQSSKCDVDYAKKLSHAQDHDRRVALDVANIKIQAAMKNKIWFLARYEIVQKLPIHESKHSILIRAIDHEKNQKDDYYSSIFGKFAQDNDLEKAELKRSLKSMGLQKMDDETISKFIKVWNKDKYSKVDKIEFASMWKNHMKEDNSTEENQWVALKFIKHKDSFEREINARRLMSTDSKSLNDSFLDYIDSYELGEKEMTIFDESNNELEKKLKAFKHLLVMPLADRNLEEIKRREHPSNLQIQTFSLELLKCINNIHEKGIIHGNLKPSHIVRYNEKLQMIDFEAYSYIHRNGNINSPGLSPHYAGRTFTSGSLPPEMIFECTNNKDTQKYLEYFEDVKQKDMEFWKKIKPKQSKRSGRIFVVKTFLTTNKDEKVVPKDEAKQYKALDREKTLELPYEPMKTTISIDIWALGTMIYFMSTGQTLFDVDANGDLKHGKAMRELYDWKDVKHDKLALVTNITMKNLLNVLLSEDPEKRGNIKRLQQILDEPFVDDEECMKNHIITNEKEFLSSMFKPPSINMPTSFIILPFLIEEISKKQDDMIEFGNELIFALKQFEEDNYRNVPKLFLQSKYFEKCFLYLIDEYDYSIAVPTDPYPIEIEQPKEDILKVMLTFLTALKTCKSMDTFMKLFFSRAIPSGSSHVWENFKLHVEDYWNLPSRPFRSDFNSEMFELEGRKGHELQQLEKILLVRDPHRVFSDLVRVFNPEEEETGQNTMWVSSIHYETRIKNKDSKMKMDEIDQLYRKSIQEDRKQLNAQRIEIERLKKELENNSSDNLRKEFELAKKQLAKECHAEKVQNEALLKTFDIHKAEMEQLENELDQQKAVAQKALQELHETKLRFRRIGFDV